MITRLHRAFWRYCELVGWCEAAGLPDDELIDGQPELAGPYIADGIRDLERYLARRGRRRPQRR